MRQWPTVAAARAAPPTPLPGCCRSTATPAHARRVMSRRHGPACWRRHAPGRAAAEARRNRRRCSRVSSAHGPPSRSDRLRDHVAAVRTLAGSSDRARPARRSTPAAKTGHRRIPQPQRRLPGWRTAAVRRHFPPRRSPRHRGSRAPSLAPANAPSIQRPAPRSRGDRRPVPGPERVKQRIADTPPASASPQTSHTPAMPL